MPRITNQQKPIGRYFAFQRLFYEMGKNLSDPDFGNICRAAAAYCFEGAEPPTYAEGSPLAYAWAAWLPELETHKANSLQGQHGGKVSGRARAEALQPEAKAKGSKPSSWPDYLPAFDQTEAPQASGPCSLLDPFISEIITSPEGYGSYNLTRCKKPLSDTEINWLCQNYGASTTAALICHVGLKAKQAFSKHPEASALELIRLCIAYFDKGFGEWLKAVFPKIAAHQNTISWAQYQALRFRFGRTNVVNKMHQLETNRRGIWPNSYIAKTLADFLQRSLDRAELPKACSDETPSPEAPEALTNFDKDFDLPPNYAEAYHLAKLIAQKPNASK